MCECSCACLQFLIQGCCLHSPFSICLCSLTFFFQSARLTLPCFLILTTPPPPTSHAQLPIKIHFFHFSPESDIPNGFLYFPISSVSSSRPSSTHWHVFFYHSPSHLCIFVLPWLTIVLGLSQKGVKAKFSPPLFISDCWEIMFITVRLQLLFFTALFFHVIKPQLRQQ